MPPRQSGYNNGDMFRMTRDAEQRVREMRERARNIAQSSELPPMPGRQNRNWSTDTGRRKEYRYEQEAPAPPKPESERETNRHRQEEYQSAAAYEAPEHPPQEAYEPHSERHSEAPPKTGFGGGTTIIQDMVGAIGVEEDTLLILGLILILINQKADTTLILALAYLLI